MNNILYPKVHVKVKMEDLTQEQKDQIARSEMIRILCWFCLCVVLFGLAVLVGIVPELLKIASMLFGFYLATKVMKY